MDTIQLDTIGKRIIMITMFVHAEGPASNLC